MAGHAGEAQFTNPAVNNPTTTTLRDGVETRINKSLPQDQAKVTIKLQDGRILDRFVNHVVGSVERPMTDSQVQEKFAGLVAGILPDDQAYRLMDLCYNAERLDDARGGGSRHRAD